MSAGANGFVRTDINLRVYRWSPGDTISITQNGRTFSYRYAPMLGGFVGPEISIDKVERQEKVKKQDN